MFEFSGLTGFVVITDQGMAASIRMDGFSKTLSGSGASLTLAGNLAVEINTTNEAISEEFIIDGNGNTELVEMPKGPFLRLKGNLAISASLPGGPSFSLAGDFVVEQITLKDPDGSGPLPAPKAVRIGAANVNVSAIVSPGAVEVMLTDGLGGFVFTPDGIAGKLRVTGDVVVGGVNISGVVMLEINTTGNAVDQTISVGNQNIAIKFSALEGNVVRFAILNASIKIDPFFELSGDFTVQSESDMTLYGARNVELFLGYVPGGGSLRDGNGAVKADAIGLLVTNASLGLVKLNATTSTGGALYAVYAYGEASLIGLDGLEIRGAITVRLNNTGQAIDKTIMLPEDPLAVQPVGSDGVDNNGNGMIDEAGEVSSIRVKFNSTAKIEEFSAGFNEQGEITEDSQVVISAANIFTLSGAVMFTRTPTGKIEVDLPEATVAISIPDDSGGLQEAFSITGAARFSFGGEQGFQLEDLRVSGYSIFGVGATITTPASSLRAPTADLANPASMSIVNVDDMDYLYVVYNDPNRAGLNDASILDATPEFNVAVVDASSGNSIGITVNNATVEKVTDAANDRTFRYQITKSTELQTFDGIASVTVTFLANQWSDQRGANNAAEIERFTIYRSVAAPTPGPYAMLASPGNGGTVSLQSVNAKRYIDVTFFSPTGALVDAASIDGNELKLTGAGAANLARNPDGTVLATVMRLSGNTYRYLLTPGAGVDTANLFVAGDITADFVAGSWQAGSGGSAVASAHTTEMFTVSATVQDAAAASNAISLGPLSLQGPSIGLANTQFKDGHLVQVVTDIVHGV